ncbi:BatD family protein [Polluticaenibacter yanchengensis]|uniref:BatD family protein n=1 Tax=Polluticaenibacter yanchengensis TaxID=3014562 RepID=A0ABT4ULI5_9BACT|nr:BatD family protein [Chitinophagaceae bacterium LY-5]
MNLNIKWVLSFLMLLTGFAVNGQSFKTIANRLEMAINETVEVAFEASNADISNVRVPDFTDWSIVGGPMQMQSSSNINGVSSTTISIKYYLSPKKAGKLTVPGAGASINGKQVTSNTVVINVSSKPVKDPQQSSMSVQSSPFAGLFDQELEPVHGDDDLEFYLNENANIDQIINNNVLVKARLDKNVGYMGEVLLIEYKLYSRVMMDAEVKKFPMFSGFSTIDLMDAHYGSTTYEMLNGKRYRVQSIRKLQMYPLQSGTLTIDPLQLSANCNFMYKHNSKLVKVNRTISSQPVSVQVLPFPPDSSINNFTGAVGNFDLQAQPVNKTIKRQEAVKIVVKVTGQGNWSMVQKPVINWPEGLEVFEPKIEERLDSQAVPIRGEKFFIYTISTNKPGLMQLPEAKFTYFNPELKKYETKNIALPALNVSNEIMVNANFDNQGSLDPTDIFKSVIKWGAPLAAIILLGFLLYRMKSHKAEKAIVVQDAGADNVEESAIVSNHLNNEEPVIPPSENPGNYEQYMPKTEVPSGENSLSETEKINEASETLNDVDVNAQLYFQQLKRDILAYLEAKNIRLNDAIPESDVNNELQNLLNTCDKYIYAPFQTSVNAKEWNEKWQLIKQQI